MPSRLPALALLGLLGWAGPAALAQGTEPPAGLTSLPASLDPACRDGKAELYDECGDQLLVLDAALARARSEGKVVLVVVGAEWCIWCHVFDSHIRGQTSRFTYRYGSPDAPDERRTTVMTEAATAARQEQARQLAGFVARSFVVAHIEMHHAPGTEGVLARTGVSPREVTGIPFIYTLDRAGRRAAVLDGGDAEISWSWLAYYRGYDRSILLRHLEAMRAAALAGGG